MRSRWFTAVAVTVMAAVLGTGPAPAATVPPSTAAKPGATADPGATAPPPSSSARVVAEEAYWTAERMAAAVPVDDARGRATAGGPAGPQDRTLSAAPSGIPNGTYFDGMPMVGTFFYRESKVGNADTSCTGSVVRSAGKSMVLTAGHCAGGMAGPTNHAVFVPQYRHGTAARAQPFGIFPVKADGVYTDPRYASNSKGAVSDLDLAFVLVEPNAKGSVEKVTGALTFTPGSTYEHRVTVVGYPSAASVNPKHKAIRCDVPTTRLGGFRQMRMVCKGFYGGVSGGPWIEDYDAASRTGKVVGNTGGYYGGGTDSWVTYAPVYGKDAQDLYDDADAGRDPGALTRPPYRGSADSPLLPGLGDLWTHARQIASGDFTGSGRSSLLVVWTDGEVTLFPGDGKGGFLPERRLAAPNAKWKPVATLTAGDFTGSGQFDLMVRWEDGRMTLHGDVGSNGLGSVTEMARSGSVWKYATRIAAGRFHAATYVTDLVVRWSDGELSLYTGVGAGTLGREHRLKGPNDTWKGATLLASGQFSGKQKWDLMVRWSTGALKNYVGTTTTGLGSERTVRGPSGTWAHSVLMTTGQYTGDGLANDLVVRWSDGETTMYKDTRANGLGTERMLVPPRA
ncbi:trypsin-like serine protease [Streptomyces sp. ZAF1911]|uniref:trypsin-like serine peptidase n=1 Tax=Streptomyces sp. ZAF1911 TaxID=2944129 RepID=UPI00237AC09B|nr:trypsin-like serine protease [Streptomyces sp. ZAF1911]MDD9382952.1 trypsin-like serine protease [Streptomyces sp. ZAF1911]